MSWLLVGTLAGSLIISGHADKEACEGRAVTLREQKAVVKCTEAPSSGFGLTTVRPVYCVGADGAARAC